jgi:hypothetical protein
MRRIGLGLIEERQSMLGFVRVGEAYCRTILAIAYGSVQNVWIRHM